MEERDFAYALRWLKTGKRMSREGWNGKGMWIELQKPDEYSKMTLPYLYLCTPNEGNDDIDRVPWLASQTDLLSDDWCRV